MRFLVTAPGQLGLARAYVTGGLDVHGDLHAALRGLHAHRRPNIEPARLLRLLRGVDLRLLRRPQVPAEEALPAWRRGLGRHSRRRDALAIAHQHAENLREHYALTLREWGANLERHWPQAVAAVGERRARIWRLYMALCRIGFELDRVQIHQMLGVRVDEQGCANMPLRPNWQQPERPAGPRAFELAA